MQIDPAELFKLVDELPYRERRAYLHRRDWHARFLYKFREIDAADPESVKRSRSLIVENQLWASSPLGFNDPFDMSAKFEIVGSAKDRRDRMTAFLCEQGLSLKKRESIVNRVSRLGPEEIGQYLRESHERTLRETGVCSFAGDPRSILMWTHYARNHRGYCVGYEVAQDTTTLMQALPVEYSETYPVLAWNGAFSGTDEIRKVLLRKHIGWEYEKEARIVRTDGVMGAMKVDHRAMVAIVFGCRMDAADKSLILDMLEERRRRRFQMPTVFDAKQSQSSYSLSLQAWQSDDR